MIPGTSLTVNFPLHLRTEGQALSTSLSVLNACDLNPASREEGCEPRSHCPFLQLFFLFWFLDTQSRKRENSNSYLSQAVPRPIACDRSYISLRKVNWEIVSLQSHLGLFISPRPQRVKIVRRYNIKSGFPRGEVDSRSSLEKPGRPFYMCCMCKALLQSCPKVPKVIHYPGRCSRLLAR